MAITHISGLRDKFANQVASDVDADVTAGEMVLLAGATPVAIIVLNDPAFGASSAGVITLDNTGPPSDPSAAGGTVDSFDFRDGAGNVVFSGDDVAGGDITISINPIAPGSVVDLTSFSYTASP